MSRRMGTHPSAPSLLADNGYAGQPLLALLRDRPELLGAALPRFGCDLPFLFKVLSVGTALSIQSHPDKALAERLHAERPEVGAEGTAWTGRAACWLGGLALPSWPPFAVPARPPSWPTRPPRPAPPHVSPHPRSTRTTTTSRRWRWR